MHNAQDYITEALHSLQAQTFGEFECLVMDDGSTDLSRQIVQEFARADARIILLSQPNGGIVKALNKLIQVAQGSYIARFDSDDVCHPERFATQLDYFRHDPDLAILGSKVALIGKQRGTWHYRQTDEQTRALQLMGNTCLSHPSLMVRRDVYSDFNYRSRFPHMEDMDFYCRFLLSGKGNLYATAEILMDYRFHNDNISKKYLSVQLAQRALCLSSLWQKLGIAHDAQDLEFFTGPLMSDEYTYDMSMLETSVLAIGEQLSRINAAVMTEIEHRLSRMCYR
jgi:glycosyltransferase involved in cell wall biosynthesis